MCVQMLIFINCISYIIYKNLIAIGNLPSNLKEINPEYLERVDTEAEAPTLRPPDVKS